MNVKNSKREKNIKKCITIREKIKNRRGQNLIYSAKSLKVDFFYECQVIISKKCQKSHKNSRKIQKSQRTNNHIRLKDWNKILQIWKNCCKTRKNAKNHIKFRENLLYGTKRFKTDCFYELKFSQLSEKMSRQKWNTEAFV